MGFEEPDDAIRLVFDDEDYAGAEVVCRRRVPMRVYLQIARATEDLDSVEEVYGVFGERVLKEWNVTIGGQPVPANTQGLFEVSPQFTAMIIRQWVKALIEVPGPLDEPSSNGAMPLPPVGLGL